MISVKPQCPGCVNMCLTDITHYHIRNGTCAADVIPEEVLRWGIGHGWHWPGVDRVWWMGFTRPEDRGCSWWQELPDIYSFIVTEKSFKADLCWCLCTSQKMRDEQQWSIKSISELILKVIPSISFFIVPPPITNPRDAAQKSCRSQMCISI